MKNLINLPILSLMIVGFLLAGTAAKADLVSFTISSPFQSTGSGGTVTFDATVTNNTNQVIYLNGDTWTLDALLNPSDLSDADYNIYFPLFLTPGESVTNPLFTVTVPPGTLSGIYAGSFEITGGSAGSDQSDLGSADFNVAVTGTVVPEPPTVVLLLSGLAGLGRTLRRRRIG
jgi:type 1 fimbria pilin